MMEMQSALVETVEGSAPLEEHDRPHRPDMLFIPGGTFRMGSDRHYPEEAPAHRVTVDGFWIDRHPVTNRQFKEFVNATGHVTFAEIPPDPKDYPGILPHMIYAGSLTFVPPRHALAAAGNPNVVDELKKGKQLGDRTYKVHLDGYNQMDMITGKGPSNRNEIWYFGESELGAVRVGDYKYRFIDQPGGWLGAKTKVDVPYLTNLRLDPFERMTRRRCCSAPATRAHATIC